MAAERYVCSDEARRGAVRDHATLNGIDYLEVLDHDAPPGTPRQQTLLVHCFKAVPALTKDNVKIDGGVRITPVSAISAGPAPDAADVLVVRTDAAGDFSRYSLSIVPSKTSPELTADFDPELSSVDFSFKVECARDFDCEPAPASAARPAPEPAIDYLAKDYGSFRRLMLDRMSLLMPDWTERNPADLGVALVEVLAYAADQLSYYQDAVSTEAYLGTARKRISVRRHARLLDYVLHDGASARAWVCIEVLPGTAADGGQALPAGSLILSSCTGPAALPDEQLPAAVAGGAQIFETLHDSTLWAAQDEIRLYTWGNDRCSLAAGATRATFTDPGRALHLAAGDPVLFEEVIGTATGSPADADPSLRHPVRLTRVVPRVDPLTAEEVLDVEWDAADALPFPLCISAVIADENGERSVSDLTVARGNVVLAEHGSTVRGDALDPPAAPDSGPYRPRIAHTGVAAAVPYDHERARAHPAADALREAPREALPAVVLDDGVQKWSARRDLLASDRFAPDFVVETDEHGVAHLRFGDGVLGMSPGPGVRFAATYSVGGGRAGNVGAGALAHVAKGTGQVPEGISAVRNPLSAVGGVDPEAADQARLFAPQAFRTQERAVTEADYASAAERHPGVQKAMATFRWTGSWRTVFVTVDRAGGAPMNADFEATMRDFLEPFRMAGEDLEVEGPTFVPLDIAITVCALPGYFTSEVELGVLEVFSSRDLADGRRGFFHPDNFTFGQPVYLSQVIATAMKVPGVQWVDTDDRPPKRNRFQRWGRTPGGELAAGRISMERLEIARLDNDPSRPENGRIQLFMEGGL
jgi:hypothetical protein